MILHDGSIVSGIKCSPISIEGWSDEQINHLTVGVRSLLNSLEEELTVQFYFRSLPVDFKNVRETFFSAQNITNGFLKKLNEEKE
ncbi:hypothetical protein ABK046_45730, partial [Streptomyces caeruleatus]